MLEYFKNENWDFLSSLRDDFCDCPIYDKLQFINYDETI